MTIVPTAGHSPGSAPDTAEAACSTASPAATRADTPQALAARLARHTAALCGTASFCRRRGCRRAGHCQGRLASDGEPECITILGDLPRRLFCERYGIAIDSACDALEGRIRLPAQDDIARAHEYMGITAAILALTDLPEMRPRLRRWLRQIRHRPPTRPVARILHTTIVVFRLYRASADTPALPQRVDAP